jgi:hypothetical protein
MLVDLRCFMVLARQPVKRQRLVDVFFDPAGEPWVLA